MGQVRRWAIVVAALVLGACTKAFDKILEGDAPSTDRITVAVDSSSVTVAQGASITLNASVTRVGTYSGPVTVDVERVPIFVTKTIGATQTDGARTTVPVTLVVNASATVGTYRMLVRSSAKGLPDDATDLSITIVPPPSYTLALSSNAVTIARGGIARITASVARSNFAGAVALSVTNTPGISGEVVGDSAVTLAVANDVAPGAYPVQIRGTAAGLTDRVATVVVSVTAEALQLIAPPQIIVAQTGTSASELLINRASGVGAVGLSFDDLPVGVTATFSALAVGGHTVTITMAAGASVAPAVYPVVLRARATGTPDVTVPVSLRVAAASIGVSLDAPTIGVFQGASARVVLRIARQSYVGEVRVATEGAPSGLTVTTSPSQVSGDSTTLTLIAGASLPIGDYDVTVRATPVLLPVSAERRVTLRVSVRQIAGSSGNVLLDWSACNTPSWVAVQDGDGVWQRVQPVGGAVRFNVASGRGGFAYIERSRSVVVRYMSQAELERAPIALCDVVTGTKRVTGTSLHTGPGEVWTYVLGGITATTSSLLPEFTLSAVPDGKQDLFGWTLFGTTYRFLIRRGLEPVDGESLGSLTLLGPESFLAAQANMSVGGQFVSGEQLSHSMDYLTTPACIVNPMFTRGPVGSAFASFGIPDALAVATDFHQITARSASAQGIRSITTVMHRLDAHSFTLPPIFTTPDIRTVSGSYRRLQFSATSVPTAYNGPISLRYESGLQSIVLTASSAYFGRNSINLTMPEFANVPGWIPDAAIPSNASVLWTLTLDGGDLDVPQCTEGRTTVRLTRTGTL